MAGRENHTLDLAVTDPQHIHEEMDHAYARFHQLTRNACRSDLHRPSEGTRWTNQQLLFHMMFGFLIVRRLLPLVRFFGRLPDWASRGFAAVHNAANHPSISSTTSAPRPQRTGNDHGSHLIRPSHFMITQPFQP
jgi:hypothetical protein